MGSTWSIVQIMRFGRPRCLNCLHNICDVFCRSNINIFCTCHFILLFFGNRLWLSWGYPFAFIISLNIHSIVQGALATKCIDVSPETLYHDSSFVVEQVITVIEVDFDSLNTERHWTSWLCCGLESSLHNLWTKAPLVVTHLMKLRRTNECMGLPTSSLTICKHCTIVSFHKGIVKRLYQLLISGLLSISRPDDRTEWSKRSGSSIAPCYFDLSIGPGIVNYMLPFFFFIFPWFYPHTYL